MANPFCQWSFKMLFRDRLIPKITMYEVWDQLHAKCHPLMTDYFSDLDCDKETIVAGQVSFIHWTRKTGTYMVLLKAPDMYPPAGVSVKYLFSNANREHILNQVRETAQYWMRPSNPKTEAVHYFDGKTLKRITLQQSDDLLKDYAKQVAECWKYPKLFNRADQIDFEQFYSRAS